MASIKNKHVYGTPERINEIQAELEWIARWPVARLAPGHLVVYALPPRKPSKPKEEREKADRKRRGNGYNRTK